MPKHTILKPFTHSLFRHLMLLLCLLEGIFHGYCIRFDLGDLLAVDDELAVFDSFQKVDELRVLEAWVGVVHHHT